MSAHLVSHSASYSRCWNLCQVHDCSQRSLAQKPLGQQALKEAHLSNEQLHIQLEANICDELTIPVLRVKLAEDLTLKKWIKEVKHLNDKHLEDLASHRKMAEDLYKSLRHATSSNKMSAPRTYTPSSSCLGTLSEAEHTLLMKHKGCFKCQKFYISHQSKECTDSVPEASSYKTLMESDAIAAKPKGKTMAAVGTIGAMMPSSVLNDRSSSEDDMSHLVLIDESIVNKLGLCRHRLHAKIEANSAFLDNYHENQTCIAKDTNYDLLNPPQYMPQTKDVITELKTVLNDCHKNLEEDMVTEVPNVVTLLHHRIDILAFIKTNKEHLERLDKEM
ncbi:uncharacterized protein BJ212DRAFT_1301674 [Suillus subaureus]|uniref:Uncharacterized protein n=1 Tax=Suillus subaureus TaxID=48587 RepID=A0A9P7JB53_9AGAM|nr:uncharacterized protein BJ212DRAFT_1301674 [Suillus subaureus]KAG1812154.1 hypothetical protein BJ212DRAFT_1301674 [Suillus subaureus]